MSEGWSSDLQTLQQRLDILVAYSRTDVDRLCRLY